MQYDGMIVTKKKQVSICEEMKIKNVKGKNEIIGLDAHIFWVAWQIDSTLWAHFKFHDMTSEECYNQCTILGLH